MYWDEEKADGDFVVAEDVVDIVFATTCRSLPVDHAYALSRAIQAVLPWLAGEEGAGMHPFMVADSGNGWMRPERPTDLLYPSRRSKLILRVPQARLQDALRLSGQILDVAGYTLSVEKSSIRRLSALTTIFSHFVFAGDRDEQAFAQAMVQDLKALGIRPKKMLPGKETIIGTPEGQIRTRSLMLADLSPEESLLLQQRGIGPLRHLGCGLFIPHKSINEVRQKHE